MFIIHRSSDPMASRHRGRSRGSTPADFVEVVRALSSGEINSVVLSGKPSSVDALTQKINKEKNQNVKAVVITPALPTSMSLSNKRPRGLEEFFLFSMI